MAVTMLANLVDVEVMADLVEAKLTDNIVFGAIADIDTTLVGTPGSTLLFPVYSYIGAATVVGEGSTISVSTLTASTASVTIKKWAKGVTLTDEAVLSGVGQPLNQAAAQIALSLDDAIDGDILDTLSTDIGATMTFQTTATSAMPKAADIVDALELYGENIDGVKVAYVQPKVYTEMRKAGLNGGFLPASEIAANVAVKGALGEFQGCQIVVTNRLKTSQDIYIAKPGAVKVVLKRGVNIESDRDILTKETVITGDVHGATYLYDASKAIKVTKKSA